MAHHPSMTLLRSADHESWIQRITARDGARARCLDYFIDIGAILRGQVQQLQDLSSHRSKIQIERILQDDCGNPLLPVARVLDGSLIHLLRILRGNISLIQTVRGMSSHQNGSHRYPASDEESVEKPELVLRYHPDVMGMSGPKPYAKEDGSRRRRVVLSNLPPDATLAQVLRGVRCHGGVKGVSMFRGAPFCAGDTQGALVDFVYSRSAAGYAQAVAAHELVFESARGVKFRAQAWLIPSTSYAHTWREYKRLDEGRTRAILVSDVSKEAVWRSGMAGVADVREAGETDVVVEFATMTAAARAMEQIFARRLLKGANVSCSVVGDSSQMAKEDAVFEGGVIEHVPRWDEHEAQDAEVNACAWQRYGMLARMRRERAEEQGVEEGKVPDGCGDIKSAPVPAVVKRYLDTSRFALVDVEAL